MAIKGGGVKALPLRNKNILGTFFFILLPFRNNNNFITLNYRNIDISRQSLSVGIFTLLLQNFPKISAILVQKLGKEKKIVKIRFRPFYD